MCLVIICNACTTELFLHAPCLHSPFFYTCPKDEQTSIASDLLLMPVHRRNLDGRVSLSCKPCLIKLCEDCQVGGGT